MIVMIGGGQIRREIGFCGGIQTVMLHIWITALYLNIVCFHPHEGAASASDTVGLPTSTTSTTSTTTNNYYLRPPPGHNVIPVPTRASLAQTTEPDQVHVSLAGPKHMKVSWMAYNSDVTSTVQYGTEAGNLGEISTMGVAKTYRFLFYSSGWMHHVVVGPLRDSTTYFYRCGGFGPVLNFTTPPPPGPNVSVKFAVVGDLGQTNWTASTLQHVANYDYDVLLLAGDLSYADYMQPMWDTFGKLVSPFASYKPWMVTQGNHDVESIPLLVNNFRSYNTRWNMPYLESGSTSNLYYSFEVANVHVLMLGSYTNFDPNSAQYKWLQADLDKVDRTKTPWLVAVLHAPWYNSNSAHQGEGDKMMEAMETLLYDAAVDIIFAGHIHAYERSGRVYLKKLNPCGILYLTIGDGGNREGLATTWLDPQPLWSLKRESSFGFGHLNLVNTTHAHWSWHRNQDVEEFMADEIWITSLTMETKCATKKMTAMLPPV